MTSSQMTPRSPQRSPQTAVAALPPSTLGARLGQAAMAVVPAALSVVIMISIHRLHVDPLGVRIPLGLLLGAFYQSTTCAFLYGVTGSRLPLVVLGSLWGMFAVPFLGSGAGGGVLMPGAIGDQVQLAGWIVQLLGVGIPFVAALVITVLRRLRSAKG
ncbi:hypothetical protein ACXET9_01115 [Brachybacterium sp. DNPG3]